MQPEMTERHAPYVLAQYGMPDTPDLAATARLIRSREVTANLAWRWALAATADDPEARAEVEAAGRVLGCQ